MLVLGSRNLPPAWRLSLSVDRRQLVASQHPLTKQPLLCDIPEAGGGSSLEPVLSVWAKRVLWAIIQ